MTATIRSAYICVRDMERAIKFYEGFFEKEVLKRDELYSVFDIAGFRIGFFGGSHAVVEESLKLMVEKLHFAISLVDYRLAPGNPYPVSHEDTYAALKYVYENSDKLNICKDKIFVAGDSTGEHDFLKQGSFGYGV